VISECKQISVSGHKRHDADEQRYRQLPFPPQQPLPTNAYFEETLAELQRMKINAWKHTPSNKRYFLQWTPSPVTTTSGECLLPVHCTWIDQSLSAGGKGERKVAGSVWKEFYNFV